MAYTSNLSTLAARTIISAINRLDASNWDDVRTLDRVAAEVVEKVALARPRLVNSENKRKACALATSYCYQLALKYSKMTVSEYLRNYADFKWSCYMDGDKGGFGDLLEVLVRCALVSKLSLVRPSMLHVADCMHADCVSKKYGNLEIAHNGKTLSFGTIFDYMEGPFDSIAYGVFSNEDKEDIVCMLARGEVEEALAYVREYVCIWKNKYAFLDDMNSLSRGAGITEKGDDIQVVYNESKRKAFTAAIENGKFLTMKDGDN